MYMSKRQACCALLAKEDMHTSLCVSLLGVVIILLHRGFMKRPGYQES